MMPCKAGKHTILTLLLISILFLPNISAQDYTQWHLPQGAKARIGKGRISGNIAFSPDNTRLAVATSIGIWMYDSHTREELNLLTLSTLTGNVRSLAFSPDGSTLASGRDETVRLWDVATGKHKATLTGHTGWVRSIAFSPDGCTLASGSEDQTVRLWEIVSPAKQGKRLENTRGMPSATLSHTSEVEALAFSPDGRTLASGGGYDDNTVWLWDAISGELKAALTREINDENTAGVNAVAFSPDSSILVSGHWDGTVCLWDVASGTLKATLTGHIGSVRSVAFSADGHTLASAGGYRDNTVCLWDVATGAYKTTLTAHTNPVGSVAFSPDGHLLASASSDGTVRLWDAVSHHPRATLTGHIVEIESIAFSPDGSTLASGGWDKKVHLWDVGRATHKASLLGHTNEVTSVAFSPDGQTLASAGGWDDRTVRLWHSDVMQLKAILIGHTQGIMHIAFSPDSRLLASASVDEKVCLWDAASGHHQATFLGHTALVSSVAFSPDGRTLASSSKTGIRLWDTVSRQHNATLQGPGQSLAFSPDGYTLAGGVGHEVNLWDVGSGELKATFDGHTDSVRSVAFSHDGRTLVSGGGYEDNTVRLWDVASGTHKASLTGHTGGITSVVFSPDGRTLATASDDATVLLWDFPLSTAMGLPRLAGDVNRDGVVNPQDLVFVASYFGTGIRPAKQGKYLYSGEQAADVNGEGVVDITDLVLVAAVFGSEDGVQFANSRTIEMLTPTEVQQWLTSALEVTRTDLVFQRGIAGLARLLAELTPKETALLPNYPNPFNPETWIPYQLAEPAEVTLRIYTAGGATIRTLSVGHRPAGTYKHPQDAIYWDGKNEIGESVASGVYFYTLSTGNFAATRKMLMRK